MNKTNNLKFLNILSEILSKRLSPINTMNSINKLFKDYLNAEEIRYIIWDNNNMSLKDFNADIISEEHLTENQIINYVYTNFSINKGKTFYFNEKEYHCETTEEEINEIQSENDEINTLMYPIIANGEVFGLIKLKIKNTKPDKDLLALIKISTMLISGSIINYLLNEQMEISLNFYKAMKDIAKIIESQYELSYIIPLIGEMIDRFISSHLIYIFIKKENEYKLVWPKACKDKQIYKLLEKLTDKTEYKISKDGKIGVFPITNNETIQGAIVAYSNIEKLLQKDIDYLTQLTRQSGLTLQRANMYAEVLKYATMDALTGLNNRRQFEIRLNQEVANSKRNNIPMCCMMLDVDYFKKVNDTYGHAAGDCVLKDVAQIIKNEIREYDIACRYGGEEFFIILPQTQIKEASLVAQRLRKVIEESNIDITGTGVKNITSINITVSIGVCAFNSNMSADEVAQKADKALYKAKTTGRNRVIIA